MDDFLTRPSGLIVPPTLVRDREVVTRDEWKVIDRAMKVFKARGVKVTMSCGALGCGAIDPAIEADGSRIMRCAHRDLVFARTF